MKLTWMPALTVVAALALAGCSGDDDGKDKGKDAAKDGAATGQVISPEDLPEIPTVKKPTGIIADTKQDKCSTEPGKVSANGTVTNSAKKARDLSVVVSWTSGTGGDVVGRGVATFKDVPAGAKKKWSVDATTADVEGLLQCVLSAQAGTLK